MPQILHSWCSRQLDPPGPPWDWDGYVAPDKFEDVDNPGGWSDYIFRPKYSNIRYNGHFTPNGVQVVPEDWAGKQIAGKGKQWELFYDGWTPSKFDQATYVRGDATKEGLKPDSKKGCLDAGILRKHRLAEARMKGKDAFWFIQMLFPVCNPSKSTVEGDCQIPYFSHVHQCTNMYAVGGNNLGGEVGHDFKTTT